MFLQEEPQGTNPAQENEKDVHQGWPDIHRQSVSDLQGRIPRFGRAQRGPAATVYLSTHREHIELLENGLVPEKASAVNRVHPEGLQYGIVNVRRSVPDVRLL